MKVGTVLSKDEAVCVSSAEDEEFLSSSHVVRRGRPGELGCSVESSSLDESWPDSERSSTVE